jgi:PAS domain-containing protein
MSDRLSAGAVSTIKRSNRYPKPGKQAKKPQNPDAAVEMRFRAILEQIPAVIYTDSINDNHTLYINPQIQYITGYTPEEWMEDDLLWFKNHPRKTRRKSGLKTCGQKKLVRHTKPNTGCAPGRG